MVPGTSAASDTIAASGRAESNERSSFSVTSSVVAGGSTWLPNVIAVDPLWTAKLHRPSGSARMSKVRVSFATCSWSSYAPLGACRARIVAGPGPVSAPLTPLTLTDHSATGAPLVSVGVVIMPIRLEPSSRTPMLSPPHPKVP